MCAAAWSVSNVSRCILFLLGDRVEFVHERHRQRKATCTHCMVTVHKAARIPVYITVLYGTRTKFITNAHRKNYNKNIPRDIWLSSLIGFGVQNVYSVLTLHCCESVRTSDKFDTLNTRMYDENYSI